jgi:hypothetical protein
MDNEKKMRDSINSLFAEVNATYADWDEGRMKIKSAVGYCRMLCKEFLDETS